MADDGVLLDGLRQGHPDAWHAVSARHRQRLRQLAAVALPTELAARADASDIVQQTLADASKSFASFRGDSLPELHAWLTAILRNNVSDAVEQHVLAQRRTVKKELHFDNSSVFRAGWDAVCAADQTSPSLALTRLEMQSQLDRALDSLPPRQRDALRMRHLEGRTLEYISRELRCTPQAAAAAISRGLRALRDRFKHFD